MHSFSSVCLKQLSNNRNDHKIQVYYLIKVSIEYRYLFSKINGICAAVHLTEDVCLMWGQINAGLAVLQSTVQTQKNHQQLSLILNFNLAG